MDVFKIGLGLAFLTGALLASRRSRQGPLGSLGEDIPDDARGDALEGTLAAAEALYPAVDLDPLEIEMYASPNYQPQCLVMGIEAAGAVRNAARAVEEGLSGSKSVMVGAAQAWALSQFMCPDAEPDPEIEALVVGAAP